MTMLWHDRTWVGGQVLAQKYGLISADSCRTACRHTFRCAKYTHKWVHGDPLCTLRTHDTLRLKRCNYGAAGWRLCVSGQLNITRVMQQRSIGGATSDANESTAVDRSALGALHCIGSNVSTVDEPPIEPPFEASLPPEVRGRPCYYDADRVAHCARPREHIVFMGDSLTRYQWLALAFSFHRQHEGATAHFPSLVKEREWRHWMPFYNGTTRMLGRNARCDCHRSRAVPPGSRTIENRYWWTSSGGGLNLTFIQVLYADAILGTWAPTGPNDDDALRLRARDAFAPRWRMDWATCVREVVAKLQPPPTVIVLNSGMWSGGLNASVAEALAHAARAAAPRVLWKTTTPLREAGGRAHWWARTDLWARRRFEVFDAARLTRHVPSHKYWDARHFELPVYHHLNAALLRQLYGAPVQCAKFNHGCCKAAQAPTAATAPNEGDRAAVVAEGASPHAGWAGLASLPLANWSRVQALLWVDSLGIAYDAKELSAAVSSGGGALVDLVGRWEANATALHKRRLCGISPAARRKVVIPQLRALERRQKDDARAAMLRGLVWVGHTFSTRRNRTAIECRGACERSKRCAKYTHKEVHGMPTCFLKTSMATKTLPCTNPAVRNCVSGVVRREVTR